MINIFNPANSTDVQDYESNGQATLIPTSAVFSVDINGAWQIVLEHPYDTEGRYQYIKRDAILKVSGLPIREQSNSEYQLFRIFDTQEGIISVSCVAFPVGMEASYDAPIQELDISKKSGVNAMADIAQKLTEEGVSKYTLSTNVSKSRRSSYVNTNLIALLSGTDDNSFVNTWGGEVCYDNYEIMVRKKLGSQSGNVHVEYGKNITGLTYEVDTSNVVTRIYPISADGIRYHQIDANLDNYVSSVAEDLYPFNHTMFVSTEDLLVNFDRDSKTDTAKMTCGFYDYLYGEVEDKVEEWWEGVLTSLWYCEAFIKNMVKDNLIETIQNSIRLEIEGTYPANQCPVNEDILEIVDKAVQEGIKWIKDAEVLEWNWHGSGTTADPYWYGSAKKKATSQYVYLDSEWKWFDANGHWEQKSDIDEDFDWFKDKATNKRRYGTRDRYYLKNQYIYIMESGTLKEYWLDSDGWYDEDKSGDSDWEWHGSGTAADPYWFGEEGATASDKSKYAHDQWVYYANSASQSDIKYGFYWFDSDGYYYEGNEVNDNNNMKWVKTDERWWFGKVNASGKADKEYRSVYLTNCWAKIDGDYYHFDAYGFEIKTEDSENEIYEQVLGSFDDDNEFSDYICDYTTDHFYPLLDEHLENYCLSQFDEGIYLPLVNITVNMVDLSKTTEYADFADLEKVYLGDKVKVVDSIHDRNINERVVGLKYDLLKGYNTEVSIGSPSKTAAEKIGLDGGRQITGKIEVEQTRGRKATRDATYEDIEVSKTTKKVKNKDKYIAGKGIKIVNNVISATGSGGSGGSGGGEGGLKYWTETQHEIYQKQTNNISTTWEADAKWIRDDTTSFDRQQQFPIPLEFDGRTYTSTSIERHYKVTADRAISGWYMFTLGDAIDHHGSRYPTYLMHLYVSDNPTAVSRHCYRANFNQQGEFVEWSDDGVHEASGNVEHLGITWYYSWYSLIAGVWGDEATMSQAILASQNANGTGASANYIGKYDSRGTTFEADIPNIVKTLLRRANVRVSSKTLTAIGVNQGYTFYSGEKIGTEEEIDINDATFKVSSDGYVYGEDYFFNGNETPISEQIANKQDKLTAGSNINITNAGVISATDTTYNAFTGATSQTAGSAGLVPAPAIADRERYLCNDGTWKEVSGSEVEVTQIQSTGTHIADIEVDGVTTELYAPTSGGGGGISATELSSSDYEALTPQQKSDASVLYFINDSQTVETALDVSNFVNKNEGSMTITANTTANTLVYAWNGGGSIGANSTYSIAIDKSVQKIKFKITTGTSYTTSITRFYVGIGVRTTYAPNSIILNTYNVSDWLAFEDFNTNNSVFEGELDLSGVNVTTYLYVLGHGWNMTVNYIKTVTSGTNNPKLLMYKDSDYSEGFGAITYSTDERKVGTWIDGSALFQKTVATGGAVPTGATLIERITQTGYDTIRYIY